MPRLRRARVRTSTPGVAAITQLSTLAALLFASLMLVDGQGGITFLLFGLTPRLNAVGPLLQKCLGRLHAVNPYSSRMSSRPCSAELPSDVRRRAKVTARRSMLYA